MKWVIGFAVAIVFCSIASVSNAQQCNRSGGQSSMNSPGSFGSLSSQPNSNLYSNYSGGLNSYTPNAAQVQAYNNQAQYQAMLSQRMDRFMQMQMVNQIAAQRAALRNAQKAKKAAQKEGKEAVYAVNK
jgi:hypothetical protein